MSKCKGHTYTVRCIVANECTLILSLEETTCCSFSQRRNSRNITECLDGENHSMKWKKLKFQKELFQMLLTGVIKVPCPVLKLSCWTLQRPFFSYLQCTVASLCIFFLVKLFFFLVYKQRKMELVEEIIYSFFNAFCCFKSCIILKWLSSVI